MFSFHDPFVPLVRVVDRVQLYVWIIKKRTKVFETRRVFEKHGANLLRRA